MRAPGGLEDATRRLRGELDDRLVTEAGRHEQAGRPLTIDDQRALAVTLAEEWLGTLAAERTRSGIPPLARREEEALVRTVLDGLFGAGPLQPLLDDHDIREVRMNGARTAFVVHRNGYARSHGISLVTVTCRGRQLRWRREPNHRVSGSCRLPRPRGQTGGGLDNSRRPVRFRRILVIAVVSATARHRQRRRRASRLTKRCLRAVAGVGVGGGRGCGRCRTGSGRRG